MSASESPVVRRGRPRKFARPSRAVTLTLPVDIVAALQALDADLSCAVVRIAEPLLTEAPHARAELTTFGDHAVIVVPRSTALTARTGVELVPLSDGRALMCFDDRMSIPQLELRVGDALEDAALPAGDRAMFEALSGILRQARRSDGVVLRQRSIIVLQWTKTEPAAAPQRPPARKKRVSAA